MSSLAEDNCHFLYQLARFVEGLGTEAYRRASGPYGGNGIGRQVRHILDHVEAVIADVSGEVDYDTRARDKTLERSPRDAVAALKSASDRLARLAHSRRPDDRVCVAYTYGDDAGGQNRAWAGSTLQRELMFLTSHTVHHMAVVALLAARQGIEVDDEFGVALSTLRHWQAKDAAGESRRRHSSR